MLLEPIIIAIINLLNLQVVPGKVFFKLCLKVLTLLHVILWTLAICSIFRDLKKKVSFDQQLFCEMGDYQTSTSSLKYYLSIFPDFYYCIVSKGWYCKTCLNFAQHVTGNILLPIFQIIYGITLNNVLKNI